MITVVEATVLEARGRIGTLHVQAADCNNHFVLSGAAWSANVRDFRFQVNKCKVQIRGQRLGVDERQRGGTADSWS